ncbi:MAG: class I tRNA ligase family protein, partial [Cyanobacteria bacterium J06636_16]
IPAWYAVSETGGQITDNTPFVVALNEAAAREKAIAQFGEGVQLQQDPDVLDTWFSSGLWPFSTMGWPDETTRDFQAYYPTTTLVTGFDIIFFWVARMTMMAGHFTNTMPFETVYIHGLVRDENNQKMSKSKGNGIDPLILINKYGTDALRYTLIREVAGAGQDIRLEYDRKKDESSSVEASRNFTNKLWNAARFVMLNLDGQTPSELGKPEAHALELADRWILSRYNGVVQRVREYMDKYGFGEAAKELYDFIWGDFCDWYIELAKARFQESGLTKQVVQQTLAYVLDGILRLLHPFMPHITEEIWHTLNQVDENQSLALQAYPTVEADFIDANLEKEFDLLIGTLRTIRNLRAEAGIKPSAQIETILQSENPEERRILEATRAYIQDIGKVKTLTIRAEEVLPAPPSPTETPVSAETLLTPEATTATEDVTLDTVTTEVADFWDTMRPLLEEPLTYLQRFFSDMRRPLTTVGILLLVFIASKVLSALTGTLESIPLIAPLFRLVGIGYSVWFVSQNLLYVEKRRQTWQQIKQWRRETLGDAQPWLRNSAAVPSTRVYSPTADPSPEAPSEPAKLFAGVIGTVQVLIPLTGLVDIDTLKTKLQKDLAKVEGEIKSLSGRLNNPGFVAKAPEEVVEGARAALAEAQTQAEILKSRLAML